MTSADNHPGAPDPAVLRAAAEQYHAGERRDALVFTLLGAANLGAAVAVFLAAPDQRLLALALASIGLLELFPGMWALRRQGRRAAEAERAIATNPRAWRAEELSRLHRLLEARKRLRIADAAFFVAFLGVVALAPPGERLAWLAVPGQMALLPLLNVAMERRARRLAGTLEGSLAAGASHS
jgi:hypothetical protein